MSKIFRLHTGATDNIEHWQGISGHLSDNFIDSIEDPEGSNADRQITSIPSPFARMDLVRTAFRYITRNRELEGNTIYHKIVSDCLDVGEIFFNIEALQDKIELIEWNSGIIVNGGELDIKEDSELGRLINSSNPKHALLGETLKMYLFQDQKAFNFADLKGCYLLNYREGTGRLNIIGGTSPATLFFSSANDLSFVKINFGNQKVFSNNYCPLFRRRSDFIKYWFCLERAFPNFAEKFKDIKDYLDLTFEVLDNNLQNAIRGIDNDTYSNSYNVISVNSEGNNAEILGFNLRARNYEVGPVPSDDNDFIIEPSKPVTGLIPCALPNEPFNEPLKYSGGTWQKNYHENVPYLDKRPMNERTLPNQSHIRYPYLTASDLLESYIIKLPYSLDEEKFFNGNYQIKKGKSDHSFALPIKKKFFEYFTISDLQGTVTDGKKRFELLQMPSGVKAVLRIPIKNNRYIQFSRLYSFNQFQDKIQPANEEQNLGIALTNQFTLAVYPFLKLSEEMNPHYRILFVDRDVSALTKKNNYNINFFKESDISTAINVQPPKQRSNKLQSQGVSTYYHILEDSFDFIEVNNNISTGIIIPVFSPQMAATRKFKFAIDFGTTNTHVEYKVGDDDSRPFDITEDDIQLGTLHSPDEATEEYLKNPELGFAAADLIDIIKEEFMPFLINDKSQYKFPQRTVINDNGNFQVNEPNFALADFNIPFWYLKENFSLGSEITSNLKWVDFRTDKRFERRTKGFLKQILLMIRNKVLLNNGDLLSTEIVWFYPSSMPKFRRNFLQTSWNTYFQRYFPGSNRLHKMSESFAPFYYYYHNENVRPHDRPAVSIDIGGGTSDIVVYQSEDPIVLSSFKFAANSIFGDGYGSTSVDNGFVQHFEKEIKLSLANTEVENNLISVYSRLKRSNSVELIEFFFSLEDNKLIRDKKLPLSFSKLLVEDKEFKLVFVFFYAAMIYHIAKLMKAKGLQIPEYITFSGNGSKVINLASGGSDLSTLLEYTKVIFEDVYDIQEAPTIEFRLFRSPKEITCKGGLECNDYAKFDSLESRTYTVLIGTNDVDTVPAKSLMYSEINNPKITDPVCAEVSSFIDKFFKWNAKFNYFQNFGISANAERDYKSVLNSKIKSDLIDGIKQKIVETEDNVNINIEETLFFYPLIGAINRLANKIYLNNKS